MTTFLDVAIPGTVFVITWLLAFRWLGSESRRGLTALFCLIPASSAGLAAGLLLGLFEIVFW